MTQRSLLISDDDPQMLASLARLALAGGFSVIPDLHSDVVALARKHMPSLIVLDINQDVDGRVLLGQIQMTPSICHIPVVVLSASDHPTLEKFCLSLGAKDFQTKPVNIGFVRRIGELAGVKSKGEVEGSPA